MGAMTIGRAAREAGVGVETLRFYERQGLIERPARPAGGGFRRYPEEAVRRVRFIRQAREAGFSLREVKELLALRADPGADCAKVRERAEAKREEVARKMARLHAVREALEGLIRACPGSGPVRACSILGAFESGGDSNPDREEEE